MTTSSDDDTFSAAFDTEPIQIILDTYSDMVPDDVLHFKLPSKHLPGSDRFSKRLACEQEFIDLVTGALVGATPGTYHSAGTTFLDSECDVLYLSIIGQQPIIIEFQAKVDQDFLTRAIGYCLDVTKKTKELPIILVFCLKSCSRAIGKTFEPMEDKQWLLHSCAAVHYAKKIFLVTPESVEQYISSADTIDPLLAVAHFLIAGQPSIIGVPKWSDPTILRLYQLAMKISPMDLRSEGNRIIALQEMADSIEKQLKKTVTNFYSNPQKSLEYAEAGISWARSLKRKYDKIAAGESYENTTPMSEPTNVELDVVYGPSEGDESVRAIVSYVNDYMVTKQGRMDWDDCFQQAVIKMPTITKRYANSSSFRVTFYKHRKE